MWYSSDTLAVLLLFPAAVTKLCGFVFVCVYPISIDSETYDARTVQARLSRILRLWSASSAFSAPAAASLSFCPPSFPHFPVHTLRSYEIDSHHFSVQGEIPNPVYRCVEDGCISNGKVFSPSWPGRAALQACVTFSPSVSQLIRNRPWCFWPWCCFPAIGCFLRWGIPKTVGFSTRMVYFVMTRGYPHWGNLQFGMIWDLNLSKHFKSILCNHVASLQKQLSFVQILSAGSFLNLQKRLGGCQCHKSFFPR